MCQRQVGQESSDTAIFDEIAVILVPTCKALGCTRLREHSPDVSASEVYCT